MATPEYVSLMGETEIEASRMLIHINELADVESPDHFFHPKYEGKVREIGRVQILGDVDQLETIYEGEAR